MQEANHGGEYCTADQASVLEVEWYLIMPDAGDENLKTYAHRSEDL